MIENDFLKQFSEKELEEALYAIMDTEVAKKLNEKNSPLIAVLYDTKLQQDLLKYFGDSK